MVVTSQWASFAQRSPEYQPKVVLGARHGYHPDNSYVGYDYYYGYEWEDVEYEYGTYDWLEPYLEYVGPPSNVTLTSLGATGGGPHGTGYVSFEAESLQFLQGGNRGYRRAGGANSCNWAARLLPL